jgi:hypothetical protein
LAALRVLPATVISGSAFERMLRSECLKTHRDVLELIDFVRSKG